MDKISEKNLIVENAELKVKQYFLQVDEIKEYNQEKVLKAFCKHKIGLEHFASVSGYGHDDMGREALDRVYADVFKADPVDAAVFAPSPAALDAQAPVGAPEVAVGNGELLHAGADLAAQGDGPVAEVHQAVADGVADGGLIQRPAQVDGPARSCRT